MAQPQRVKPVESADPIWARIRSEAEAVVRQEPQLASFIYASLLEHDALTGAVVQRISDRLDHPVMTGTAIRQAFLDALTESPARPAGSSAYAPPLAAFGRSKWGVRLFNASLSNSTVNAESTTRPSSSGANQPVSVVSSPSGAGVPATMLASKTIET